MNLNCCSFSGRDWKKTYDHSDNSSIRIKCTKCFRSLGVQVWFPRVTPGVHFDGRNNYPIHMGNPIRLKKQSIFLDDIWDMLKGYRLPIVTCPYGKLPDPSMRLINGCHTHHGRWLSRENSTDDWMNPATERRCIRWQTPRDSVAQRQLWSLLLLVDGGSRENGFGLGSKLKPMLLEKLDKTWIG